jgi:hypothetical protein
MPNTSLITENQNLVLTNRIVSISGPSGTGKTTLALQLASSLIMNSTPYHHQCLWIKASEQFPKKRLETIFYQKKNMLRYLRRYIFVIPSTTIQTYREQLNLLNQFEQKYLPPEINVILIVNISHHLRYEISQQQDINIVSSIKNTFYDTILFPIIMYCQREKVVLLLLHEVSSDLESGRTKPFFSRLYDRIGEASISLYKH